MTARHFGYQEIFITIVKRCKHASIEELAETKQFYQQALKAAFKKLTLLKAVACA